MIETWVSVRARRTETIRVWVIKVGILARGSCVFVIGGSADSQHFAVGQNRRVHLDPRLGHRWSGLPLERGGREVDDLRRRRGWGAAAQNHHPRSISVRRG